MRTGMEVNSNMGGNKYAAMTTVTDSVILTLFECCKMPTVGNWDSILSIWRAGVSCFIIVYIKNF